MSQSRSGCEETFLTSDSSVVGSESCRMEAQCMASNAVVIPVNTSHGACRDDGDYPGDYEAPCESIEVVVEAAQSLKALSTVDVGKPKRLSGQTAAEETSQEEREQNSEISRMQTRRCTTQIEAFKEPALPKGKNATRKTATCGRRAVEPALESDQDPHEAAKKLLKRNFDDMLMLVNQCVDEKNTLETERKMLENEASGSQQQIKKLQVDLKCRKAEAAELAKAREEDKKLETLCRSLLKRVEQRNRPKSSELRNEIRKRDVKIEELQGIIDSMQEIDTIWVCIVCINPFSTERHRAHWKDCSHANVCFECSKNLWRKKRMCPSCNTPASSMPTRLHIFL